MQKNAAPNSRQAESLKAAGLTPSAWTVAKELRQYLIIRSRITGEFRKIKK